MSHVLAYWKASPFDLRLPADEKTGKTNWGNCTLCFLKGTVTLIKLIRERPDAADWWIAREEEVGAKFRNDRPSYAELRRVALDMAPMPLLTEADYEGMACGEDLGCACTD